VKPGDRVAICLPKTLETMRVMMGVLAAGGAYVMLQFRGPPARIRAILASIEPRLLVTTPEMSAQLAADVGDAAMPPVLHVDSVDGGHGLSDLLRSVRPLADTIPIGPDDLAAIVFTSGSTGEPKGVMRSQRNLFHHMTELAAGETVRPGDVCPGVVGLHYTTPVLFFPIVGGARVHLLTDQDVMFPEVVAESLERERATVLFAVVSALRLMVERGELAKRDFRSLRRLHAHGEAMPPALLRTLMEGFPNALVGTLYGATEAPGAMRYTAPRPLPEDFASVPLGRFTDYYTGLICDEDGQEVAPGEVGEICLIGPLVTCGYWKDPELTRRRRLGEVPDSYRTGDLAYATPDGLLHFAGRRDHQVKLRGHRFDLGEIEAALKRHPSVREAVALALPRDGGEIVIHAVVEAGPEPELPLALRQLCAERLPRYAWPERVSVRPELPRLPNGKIDRQTLRHRETAAG